MQQPNSIIVENFLTKYNLKKSYEEGQIVFIKLDGDQHHWPAKISTYFIQHEKKSNKSKQKEDQYDPDVKSKRGRSSKKQSKFELIYKVRYFQWQSFAYVTDKQIKAYELTLEKDLLLRKDKKIQKAIQRARFQMGIQQKLKLQIQIQNAKVSQQQKLSKSCMNLRYDFNSTGTTQVDLIDKKQKKIRKIKEKQKLRKKNLQAEQSKILENNKKLNNNQSNQGVQNTIQEQKTIVKQQYNYEGQNSYNEGISLNKSREQDEQYLLNNILFKNKFQILGILSDLLEDFLCWVLWLDNESDRKMSFKQQKRLNTLNKVLQSELFNYQELSQSRCLQKMVNIIKIGQLTIFSQKICDVKLKSKLNKGFAKIVYALKKFTKNNQQRSDQLNNSKSFIILNGFSSKCSDLIQQQKYLFQQQKRSGNEQKSQINIEKEIQKQKEVYKVRQKGNIQERLLKQNQKVKQGQKTKERDRQMSTERETQISNERKKQMSRERKKQMPKERNQQMSGQKVNGNKKKITIRKQEGKKQKSLSCELKIDYNQKINIAH